MLRMLMVEDVETDAQLAERELRRAGIAVTVQRVDREEPFRRALAEFAPQVVLSDFSMPDFDGMRALAIAQEVAPDVPFIFVSGTLGEEYAIRALKSGATDYVLKGNLMRLPPVVERAVSEGRARRQRRREDQLLALEHAVVRHLADAEDASDGLGRVMREICRTEGWDVARYFRVDEPSGVLRFEGGWSSPGALEGFLERSRHVTLRQGEGLAGLAWKSGEPLWADDTGNDARVSESGLSGDFGLRSAFVLPVTVESRVIGVTAYSCGEAREADQRLLRSAGVIGSQLGQFLARQEQQRHVARLNRLYAVLSGINAAIVRIEDRDTLFREACRIAVRVGGLRMAWIGMVETGKRRVRPLAWEGADDAYMAVMPLGLGGEGGEARGLVARAILERRAIIVDDMADDPRVELKSQAGERGLRSLAMLPVMLGGEAAGVVALYSDIPGYFRDDQEMQLLLELAGDVAFALEHMQKADRLRYLAYHDPLTGLANATFFLERLVLLAEAARTSGEKFTVALLDIDRFKTINDSLGRQAGDEVLRELARRLRATVGRPESLARVVGDRFAFVLQEARSPGEMAVLWQARYASIFGAAVRASGTDLRLSGKVGFATFPGDGEQAETLFKHAEAALKKAKERNEPYLFYAEPMGARVAERLALETQLRRAVEERQFVLHYQPKVDSDTRKIVGLEALIRWNHPTRGLVPPLEFIPVLEETGLILETGAWALERAASDHRSLLTQGVPAPRVAVNVSAIQLRRADFVATLERALAQGAAPGGLDLEITESLVMEDIAANIEKLHAVRSLGVGVAIDDFGTGYSSLAYLAKLPVQSLKIDRSFVGAMTREVDTMTLVSTMISLAHALRLRVVAEGVESEEQANVLRLLRCDEVQGYLVSKPLPLEDVARLLARP